jgi:hypothetical protein
MADPFENASTAEQVVIVLTMRLTPNQMESAATWLRGLAQQKDDPVVTLSDLATVLDTRAAERRTMIATDRASDRKRAFDRKERAAGRPKAGGN